MVFLTFVPVHQERSSDEDGRVCAKQDTDDECQDEPFDRLATKDEQRCQHDKR